MTAMTRLIVSATSASVSPGWAKSMPLPSRSRPRDSSWLLIYSDAVRKFSDSIIAADACSSSWGFLSSRSDLLFGHERSPKGRESLDCCWRRGFLDTNWGSRTVRSLFRIQWKGSDRQNAEWRDPDFVLTKNSMLNA